MNRKAVRKELTKTIKKEKRLIYRACEDSGSFIQDKVNGKIPGRIKRKLDGAFKKAFSLIYTKGSKIIRKTYSEKKMKSSYVEDRQFANAIGSRMSIRSFSARSKRRCFIDCILACMEGVGLGLLGRGIISIPLFVSITFRNIYQTALSYGFNSDDDAEQYLMLAMMKVALSGGPDVEAMNEEIDELIRYVESGRCTIDDNDFEEIINDVSEELSNKILYIKAMQIIPIVGGIVGFADIHFFLKVHRYIDIKYRKRFLVSQVG